MGDSTPVFGLAADNRLLLIEELSDLAIRFGDERRTVILDESKPFPLPSGGDAGSSLVLLSRLGFVKAQPIRGGAGEGMAGAKAMSERAGDFVTQALVARAETELLAFTSTGLVKSIRVADLPVGTRSSRGGSLGQLMDAPPCPSTATSGDRVSRPRDWARATDSSMCTLPMARRTSLSPRARGR